MGSKANTWGTAAAVSIGAVLAAYTTAPSLLDIHEMEIDLALRGDESFSAAEFSAGLTVHEGREIEAAEAVEKHYVKVDGVDESADADWSEV